MELNLNCEALLKTLSQVSGVVERKRTMAILGNVLFDAREERLAIIATDLEVELVGFVKEPDVCSPGRITLPARKLIDICRAFSPEDTLHFKLLKNQKMTVSCGRSRFNLATLPSEDFPSVEPAPNVIEFNLANKDMRFLIERTHFSMAQQDVRYYLNGLLLDFNENTLRAVATNGHRLALACLPNAYEQEYAAQAIIPRKAVSEMLRVIDDSEETVLIKLTNNHIILETQDIILISKLIEGRFPDYERVLPRDGDKQTVIEREKIKNMMSRVSILANEKYHGIRLQLSEGLLHVSANNPEQEEAEEELELDYHGEDLDIGFNVKYILDVLDSIPSKRVKFTFSSANSSALIESADEDNDDCSYVVMPMRL